MQQEAMQHEDLTQKVDTELIGLQNNLKDRLKETNELGDLNQSVFKNTLSLEKHTAQLEKTSVLVKYKWMWEYAKWMIIAVIVIGLLVWIAYRMLMK